LRAFGLQRPDSPCPILHQDRAMDGDTISLQANSG
jgi:hypothetical protein